MEQIIPPDCGPAVPAGPRMTACEVLTWIAFANALPMERIGDLELAGRSSWTRAPGEAWAPFPDLPAETVALNSKRIAKAAAKLREELAAGCLKASGCTVPCGPHAYIPPTVFMDRTVSVCWWDMIESTRDGQLFWEVGFNTAEVLARWPALNASKRDSAAQPEVTNWLISYYKQNPRAKREHEAFPACQSAIGATWAQMVQAMRLVPEPLKNRRGRAKKIG